jgi:hypothetical protein
MIAFGEIGDLLRDHKGNWRVLFTVEDPPEPEELDRLRGKRLEITARPKKDRRTLDANSYYWVLISKLAKAIGVSIARAHNMVMRSYGTPEDVDGQIITVSIPETDTAEERALEAETFHVKPTAELVIGDYGQAYRIYILMKPSHTMDTAQFSALINGLVEECKALGIETLPPAELERMMMTWEQAKVR